MGNPVDSCHSKSSALNQAAGDSSPLPPLRIRLGDDDEWEELLEEHEEWLDENGHKLVQRAVVAASNGGRRGGKKNRGLSWGAIQ